MDVTQAHVGVGVPRGGAPLSAVVIGASAGGPGAIEQILRELPADFPAPVAVCQHTLEGQTAAWARRLDEACAISVCEAVNGARFEPGCAYIAPAGKHMRLSRVGGGVRVSLLSDFADSLFVPSIDFLMSSAAAVYGSRVLAVILTGLCSDGALGMLAVHNAGGRTVVESVESAMAASMPRAATQLGAAQESAPLDRMAALIRERVAGRG